MPTDVEHGDAALRYSDGFWYNIVARRWPGHNYFFTEIYRSTDLRGWEAGTGMGAIAGDPTMALKAPIPSQDKAIAPRSWHPRIFDFLANLVQFWSLGDDCNATDMDLVEWRGMTLLIWNWGCQQATEAVAIGTSPMPLRRFLKGWFTTKSTLIKMDDDTVATGSTAALAPQSNARRESVSVFPAGAIPSLTFIPAAGNGTLLAFSQFAGSRYGRPATPGCTSTIAHACDLGLRRSTGEMET